jgi:hypothetical protein
MTQWYGFTSDSLLSIIRRTNKCLGTHVCKGIFQFNFFQLRAVSYGVDIEKKFVVLVLFLNQLRGEGRISLFRDGVVFFLGGPAVGPDTPISSLVL